MVYGKIKDVVNNAVEKVKGRADRYDNILFQSYADIENNPNIKKDPLNLVFRLALVFMLADMFVFGFMETWSAPVVIGFLQIIILLIRGVSGGLTDFSTIFNWIGGNFGRKDSEPKK